MLGPPGAGATARPDARLAHEGQGAFERRPKRLEWVGPQGERRKLGLHNMYVYIIRYIQCTIKKNALPAQTPTRQRVRSRAGAPGKSSALSSRELLAWFLRLVPQREFGRLPAFQNKRFYARLFTPLVTLWYLLFQRLQADHTLDAVVADAQDGGADSLCQRLSQRLLSSATASFSNARQRLPLACLSEVLALQVRRLLEFHPQSGWQGLRLCLLDGSTVRLRPHGDIARHYPPHRNQTPTPAYWCLMRVVVAFCARTGAALACVVGGVDLGEQALACQLMLHHIGEASLFIGDRNFGVFRIVQCGRAAGAHTLVRLTDARARKLLGRALRPGDHALAWSPSRKDRLQPGCSAAPLPGRLLVAHVQPCGFRAQTLCLFTTLPSQADYPLAQLVGLYGLRWHIELNRRYLKAQMRLVQLECKSADLAQKEWFAGLLAYNLIRAAMLGAALQRGCSPLALSFSSARRHLEHWLKHWGATGKGRPQWARMLRLSGQARLPERPQPRPAEPRAQRHLRQPYPPLIGPRQIARQKLQTLTPKS